MRTVMMVYRVTSPRSADDASCRARTDACLWSLRSASSPPPSPSWARTRPCPSPSWRSSCSRAAARQVPGVNQNSELWRDRRLRRGGGFLGGGRSVTGPPPRHPARTPRADCHVGTRRPCPRERKIGWWPRRGLFSRASRAIGAHVSSSGKYVIVGSTASVGCTRILWNGPNATPSSSTWKPSAAAVCTSSAPTCGRRRRPARARRRERRRIA